ncbi:MAG: right-handed parallel beta-helix repeat-containing protein, partial [Thermocrispum sp.]
MRSRAAWAVTVGLAAVLGLAATADVPVAAQQPASPASQEVRTTPGAAPAPSADPPAAVCGSNSLDGPSEPPSGAIVVPTGSNASFDFTQPGVTYWFAPGVHTLGDGEFDQIGPGSGSTFVGAPGAILHGRKINRYAFGGQAADVTIRHLTVRGFVAPNNEGVVNHDSGDGWTIEHSTITANRGAGMMAGSGQRVVGNCLKDNGQYGLNAYQAGNKIADVLVQGNEFAGNNTDDWESQISGCGCTGAMKFWSVDGADILDNWIHHN